MSDDEDQTWTTGKDPGFSYVRAIDSGAFGEVHEVCLIKWMVLIQFIAPRWTNRRGKLAHSMLLQDVNISRFLPESSFVLVGILPRQKSKMRCEQLQNYASLGCIKTSFRPWDMEKCDIRRTTSSTWSCATSTWRLTFTNGVRPSRKTVSMGC